MEWQRFRELQRDALLHLIEVGPTQWEILYDHLNHDGSGEAALALRYMARWMHIAVAPDDMVSITASGMSQIKPEK